MEWFSEGFVVGAYVTYGFLFLFGVAALIAPSPRLHMTLLRVTTAVWIMVLLQTISGFIVLIWGQGPFSWITGTGYLVAAIVMLPLLGIGRLGEPAAPGVDRNPDAPVLSPRQIAKVDGIAAMVIGAGLIVIAWRLGDVLAPVVG